MNVGDKAPDFTLYSEEKQPVNLHETLKNGPVLLLFFPAAFTGTCTTELHEVTNNLGAYSPAQVFGVSTDTIFSLAEYSKSNGFKVSLLSDHNAEVAEAFDCKFDHNFGPMKYDRIARRGSFLIDTDGIVQYAEVLDNPGNLPDLAGIIDTIASL